MQHNTNSSSILVQSFFDAIDRMKISLSRLTIISYHDTPDDMVGWFLVQDIVNL